MEAARESRQIEGKCDKTLSHHTTTRRVTHPDQALNLEWPSKLCTRKENNTKCEAVVGNLHSMSKACWRNMQPWMLQSRNSSPPSAATTLDTQSMATTDKKALQLQIQQLYDEKESLKDSELGEVKKTVAFGEHALAETKVSYPYIPFY